MTNNNSQIKYVKIEDCVPMPELGRSYYDQTSYYNLRNTFEKEGCWNSAFPAVAFYNEETSKWEIFAGIHRLKIAKELGIAEIPLIQSQVTREQAIAMGINSNMKQGPYNPIDIAQHMAALGKAHVNSIPRGIKINGRGRPAEYDEEFIAGTYGWSQPTVHRYLSLLSLPIEVQEMVGKRVIGMRHALAILKLEDPLKMVAVAEECASKGWSIRETERRVELALRNPDLVPQYKACTDCGRGFKKEDITRVVDELCPDCLQKRRERQHREDNAETIQTKTMEEESAIEYMRRTKEDKIRNALQNYFEQKKLEELGIKLLKEKIDLKKAGGG